MGGLECLFEVVAASSGGAESAEAAAPSPAAVGPVP